MVERDPPHAAAGLPGIRCGLAQHGEHGRHRRAVHRAHGGRLPRGPGGVGEPAEVLTGGQRRADDRTGRRADGQVRLAEVHPVAARSADEPGHPGRTEDASRSPYECPVVRVSGPGVMGPGPVVR
ncbi:hypothetical protein ACFXA3_27560 [Streptomyces sp. NPDC059456]|uniref:hypothetical protein n=1 Tax=Streptomyces sp. NPDC059456 TaxID=3346838 RepID=UPI0036CB2E5A